MLPTSLVWYIIRRDHMRNTLTCVHAQDRYQRDTIDDRAACKRGVSIYLPDTAFRMLPDAITLNAGLDLAAQQGARAVAGVYDV